MTQTIDVTGLSPEAIRTVESLVGILREGHLKTTMASSSIFDLFGKAEVLRTGDDIAEQLRDERDSCPIIHEADLLRRLNDNPDNEQDRVDYLKWLEDSGDERAAFLRLLIEHQRIQRKRSEIERQIETGRIRIADGWLDVVIPLVIRSPIAGRIYTIPSPDSRPFVAPGDIVGPDTIVGLIEVMMLFNEIKAEVRGVVKEICVSNGQAVEYNQVLFKISRPPKPIAGG